VPGVRWFPRERRSGAVAAARCATFVQTLGYLVLLCILLAGSATRSLPQANCRLAEESCDLRLDRILLQGGWLSLPPAHSLLISTGIATIDSEFQ
jgi:hypothetical protein